MGSSTRAIPPFLFCFCSLEWLPYDYRWGRSHNPNPITELSLDGINYVRINGVWFRVEFDKEAIHTGLRVRVDFEHWDRYVLHKRQVGRKELHREIYPKLRLTTA